MHLRHSLTGPFIVGCLGSALMGCSATNTGPRLSEQGGDDSAGSGGEGSGGKLGLGGASGGQLGLGGSSGEAGGSGGSDQRDDEPDWGTCPQASEYPKNVVGDHFVDVAASWVACGLAKGDEDWASQQRRKTRLHIPAGRYRLPSKDLASVALPACVQVGDEQPVALESVATTHLVEDFPSLDLRIHRYHPMWRQPGGGRSFSGTLGHSGATAEMPRFSIPPNEPDTLNVESDELAFGACRSEEGKRDTVRLANGVIAFDSGETAYMAGNVTAGGLLWQARGTFEGVDFEQSSYLRLFYKYGQHHLLRSFAVLFDQPIGDVCGLEVVGLETTMDEVPDEAFVLNCSFRRVRSLKVLSHEMGATK